MREKSDFGSEELIAFLNERGKNAVKRFGVAATSGVNNQKLVSILTDVKDYWKDVYRPALVSLACEAVGGQPEQVKGVSLAITLASAGIGLHDDIVDSCSKKHFRMTILGTHGRDGALLAGDLLIIKGLAHMQKALVHHFKPEKVETIIKTYMNFFIEICETEFMEISCRRNLETELEYYRDIIWKSTADTEACMRLGAIIGGGSQSEINALGEFGRRHGFMCRLTDELKDTLNLEGYLPHRLKYESVPLPILYAAKTSPAAFSEIKSVLEKSNMQPVDNAKILRWCFVTKAFQFVHDVAERNVKEANKRLRSLKRGKIRTILELMIDKSYTDLANLPGLCLNHHS
jgi:geranylgeranyl pyrophosphate synthase